MCIATTRSFIGAARISGWRSSMASSRSNTAMSAGMASLASSLASAEMHAATVVAAGVNPAGENDLGVDMGLAECAASVSAFKLHCFLT